MVAAMRRRADDVVGKTVVAPVSGRNVDVEKPLGIVERVGDG